MAAIYRYTCSPNYPVITEAFVIFAIQAGDKADPMEIGRMLANVCACSHAGESEEKLVKIADNATVLLVEGSYNGYQVLHYENGEY